MSDAPLISKLDLETVKFQYLNCQIYLSDPPASSILSKQNLVTLKSTHTHTHTHTQEKIITFTVGVNGLPSKRICKIKHNSR